MYIMYVTVAAYSLIHKALSDVGEGALGILSLIYKALSEVMRWSFSKSLPTSLRQREPYG